MTDYLWTIQAGEKAFCPVCKCVVLTYGQMINGIPWECCSRCQYMIRRVQ